MLYIFFLLIYIINFYKLSAFKIPFYFKDRPLIDIINEVSLKNGVYFLYPLHPQDFSEFRELVINYKSKELFVDRLKALDLVIYFLNIAGFGVYKAKDNFYIILKVKAINDDSILRYNLPLYINSALDDLPKNDIFIRYLFIFSKLKVDDQNSKILNDILLKLSNENILLSTIFKDFNSILVSGPSNKIKELIYILKSLDNSIENSTFCIVDLDNVTSNYVINIINNLKNAISFDYKSHIFYDNKSQFYNINFNTRLIPFEKNRIIILGSESHVDSLASFIKDELDVIEDNGKSILHTYNLNYLDAQSIAPIIQGILDNNQTSLSQANSIEKGYNFNGAQVLAEYNASSAQKASSTVKIGTMSIDLSELGLDLGQIGLPTNIDDIKIGGNRLLIACKNKDWKIIKELIRSIDVPRPQVVLECVIVDVRLDKTKILQSAIRNLKDQLINPGVQFLSNNLSSIAPVLQSSQGIQFYSPSISSPIQLLGNTPSGLVQDLLSVIGPNSVAAQLPIGTTLISLNDQKTPGIFGLLNILQSFVNLRVLAHPFLVSTTNKKTYIQSTATQRVRGALAISNKGTFEIPIEEITSTITIEMVPVISYDNKVKLDIGIIKVDFIESTLNRTTRFLKTTATLNDSQIIVIGGLNEERIVETKTGSPLLLNLPLIGWLFKGQILEVINTNILLIVSPKIIYPKVNSYNYMKMIVEDKLNDQVEIIDLEIFPKKDPIIDNMFYESSKDLNIISNYAKINNIKLKNSILSKKRKIIKDYIIDRDIKDKLKDIDSLF